MASVESSEEFSRSSELLPELNDLLSRWDDLTQAERDWANEYSKFVDRGYRVTKYMMRVRPNLYPKQQLFLSLNDLEVYTGGSGGGGKSDALLLAALQFVDIPSYSAVIFRATFTNLEKSGAIMDRAKDWLIYDGSDVHWNANSCCFTFPSGAKLSFAYMQSKKHADNHRSAEYTYCVGRGTLVQMANGALIPIERISIGDMVRTLEGPRRVTRITGPMLKPCVAVKNHLGMTVQIQGESHRLLDSRGGWSSYLDICASHRDRSSASLPTRFRVLRKTSAQRLPPSDGTSRIHGNRLSGQRRRHGSLARRPGPPGSMESYASSTNTRIFAEESRDSRQGTLRLAGLSCQRVPPSRHLHSGESSSRLLWHARQYGLDGTSAGDCPADCFSYCGLCGEPPRPTSDICQSWSQQQDDAEEQTHTCLLQDALDNAPSHSRARSRMYVHPYTKADRLACEHVAVVPFSLHPCGVREVFDITVESASHYITSCNLVNSNCGYDEVTEIPELCYRFLFSRMRRNKVGPQVPLRARSASNPGGEFAEWVKGRFLSKEYLECRDNDFRFNRIWKRSEACSDCHETGLLNAGTPKERKCFYCDGAGRQYRTFIPSRIDDNPSLDADEYRRSLSVMPFVERMQMEHGDWNITAEGGVFRQAWFRQYLQTNGSEYFTLIRFDEHGRSLPNLIAARRDCTVFVTADTATKEKTSADYSVIATWALHRPTGSLLLLDVIRTKVDTPDLMPLLSGACLTAKARFVLIEEASSGVELLQKLRRNNQCIGGIPVLAYLTGSKDKVARSVPAQLRMESGMIYFPSEERPWKSECQAELLSFPKAPHDDFVDNVSMAAWYAENQRTIHIGGIGDAPTELTTGPKLGGANIY